MGARQRWRRLTQAPCAAARRRPRHSHAAAPRPHALPPKARAPSSDPACQAWRAPCARWPALLAGAAGPAPSGCGRGKGAANESRLLGRPAVFHRPSQHATRQRALLSAHLFVSVRSNDAASPSTGAAAAASPEEPFFASAWTGGCPCSSGLAPTVQPALRACKTPPLTQLTLRVGCCLLHLPQPCLRPRRRSGSGAAA